MRANLGEVTQSANRLPTAPGVALRLVELTRCDEVSVRALADLVALDPVVTARVLKAANASPDAARRVGSLTQAAEVVGRRGMKALALSFAPLAAMNDACWTGFQLERFWDRSLARALAASAVAEQTRSVDPDEAYAAGLLYDFGHLVLVSGFPTQYEGVLSRVADRGCRIRDAEAELLGTTHVEIAARLFEAWHFPERFCEGIAALADADAPDSAPALAHVLAAADAIAEQLCRSPTAQREHISQQWRAKRQLFAIPATASSFEAIEAEARQRLAERALELHVELRTREQQQDELLRRARTDPVTSVGNRPAFDERFALELDRAQRTGRPVVLLLADLDHFKAINDRYGHAAGDEVLRTAARAINEVTRSVDLVARYGGDEFAVIAPECTFSGAHKLAERLRSAIEKEPVECNGRRVRATISVGAALAQWSEHAATPDALFTAADEQLYAAKHAGRNCTRVCRVGGEAVPSPHLASKRVSGGARRAKERWGDDE